MGDTEQDEPVFRTLNNEVSYVHMQSQRDTGGISPAPSEEKVDKAKINRKGKKSQRYQQEMKFLQHN